MYMHWLSLSLKKSKEPLPAVPERMMALCQEVYGAVPSCLQKVLFAAAAGAQFV